MYCQMLERAVREIAGEEVAAEARTSVNLGVDIRLPESYIAESNQRLVCYKRIASAEDIEGLARIRSEMEDRFGRLPAQGDALFQLAELRLLAARLGVRSIDYTDGALQVKFAPESPVDPGALIALLAGRDEATLTSAGVLKLPLLGPPVARVEAALGLLNGLG
jgi:transcription-repair coupling factor (superfamily II helicase)